MDISDQISALLNSPDGMEKLKNAANSLFQGGSDAPSPEPEKSGPLPDISSLLSGAENIGSIMKVMSLLKNKEQDKRVGLLLALKPHLSTERGKKVDKAISILKVASLIPVLKEEGILENLL